MKMIQEKKHHRFGELKRPPIQFDLLFNLINVQKPHTVFLNEHFRMLRQKKFHGKFSKWFSISTHLIKTTNTMLMFL